METNKSSRTQQTKQTELSKHSRNPQNSSRQISRNSNRPEIFFVIYKMHMNPQPKIEGENYLGIGSSWPPGGPEGDVRWKSSPAVGSNRQQVSAHKVQLPCLDNYQMLSKLDQFQGCIVAPRFSSSPLLSLRRSSLVEERLDEDLLMPGLLGRHR